MFHIRYWFYWLVLLLTVPGLYDAGFAREKKPVGVNYYVSSSGNDNNPGTIEAPFKTVQKINSIRLAPGCTVYLKAGETFRGPLNLTGYRAGAPRDRILITSYGNGQAIIDGDSLRGISLYHDRFIYIQNIKLIGLGRKTGNRENGLAILNSENIDVTLMDISGFQKSGLLIDSSSHIDAEQVSTHDNGAVGITVEGPNGKKDSRDILIRNCRAENNPGDPTKLDNHSGNGIVVGHCTGVKILDCTATNNGWDMPRIGNGPVGIWCYEADSVKIEHCLSYNNKTSKGGADGGGFDFDGGTTNSIIQFCYSYGNQGSGYCIFQYWGASPWHDNVICNNISENDGTISDSQAGMYIWNSSDDPKQFYNCKVYNNIVYNSKVAALSFSDKSENDGFDFYHNIFVGRDSLIKGRDKLGKCRFTGNDWWSLTSGFNAWGIKDFKKWAITFHQEQKGDKIVGFNLDPAFKNPGSSNLTGAYQILNVYGYEFSQRSVLKKLFGGNLPQVGMSKRTAF
jgi:hypothetical protein